MTDDKIKEIKALLEKAKQYISYGDLNDLLDQALALLNACQPEADAEPTKADEMEYDLAIVYEHTNLADSNSKKIFVEAMRMIRRRTAKYYNLELTAGPIYTGEPESQELAEVSKFVKECRDEVTVYQENRHTGNILAIDDYLELACDRLEAATKRADAAEEEIKKDAQYINHLKSHYKSSKEYAAGYINMLIETLDLSEREKANLCAFAGKETVRRKINQLQASKHKENCNIFKHKSYCTCGLKGQ